MQPRYEIDVPLFLLPPLIHATLRILAEPALWEIKSHAKRPDSSERNDSLVCSGLNLGIQTYAATVNKVTTLETLIQTTMQKELHNRESRLKEKSNGAASEQYNQPIERYMY